MANVYIYLLVDPRTRHVRYVGQSTDPHRRYKEHITDEADTPKTRWLREMPMLPELVIVERSNEEWAHEREQFWIDLGRKLGWQLTNSVDAQKVERPRVRVRASRKRSKAQSIRSIAPILGSRRVLYALAARAIRQRH